MSVLAELAAYEVCVLLYTHHFTGCQLPGGQCARVVHLFITLFPHFVFDLFVCDFLTLTQFFLQGRRSSFNFQLSAPLP